MPTYEYECKKCGKRFERYQPITARPSAKCPGCGGRARRRISAGGGVIFKGSGFYETDYKRKEISSKGAASCAGSPGNFDKANNSGKKDTGKKDNTGGK